MWKWCTLISPKAEILPVCERYTPAWMYIAVGLVFLLVVSISFISPSSLIALLVLGAIALGAGAFLRPQLALLLVFAAAGLPALLIPVPGHTMRLVEPALLLCVVLVVLYRPTVKLGISHALALLFVGVAMISFINVPDISTNLDVYAADKRLYEILLGIVAFFCGTFLVSYIKNISSFLLALLLCNIPLYLVGLFQALHWPLPAGLEFPGARASLLAEGRLWGPTSGAATFGLYLVNLFALALACWLSGTRKWERYAGGAVALVTALEIIGSGTRSAALGSALVLVIALLLTRRYKMLLMTIAVGVLCGALFFKDIAPLFFHAQTSISNRLFLWQYALQLILAHPWLGIGLQQFHLYYGSLIVSPDSLLNAHGVSVHQQYLELALEGGIGWLIVAILLLGSICYACWESFKRSWHLLPLAALLVLLANIVTGFFDVPLDKAEGSICLFLLAGMALGCTKLAVAQGSTIVPKNPSRPAPGKDIPASTSGDARPNARKTVRTIAFQLLFWGLTGPVMFPVTALLTHYLGPDQYGEYSFTLPFLAICALLSGTGMDQLIIRRLSHLPRERWSEHLSYAAGSRLLSTGMSIVSICLLALLLPLDSELRNMLMLGTLSLFFSYSFNGWRSIFTHGFRAEQKTTVLIVLESVNRLITACVVVLVVLLHLPLLWAYVLIIYSDLPCFLVQVFIARRRFGIRIRFSLPWMRKHLLGSLSLTGYDALALITNQADILLLEWFTGSAQVGLYALALRISDPLLAMAFTFMNGLYPLLCSTFEKGRAEFARLYHEAIRILSLALLPLSIFVSMEASAIVRLLGGERFASADIIVQLLFWATAIIFYSQLAVQSCMAANMERKIPYVAGVGTVVNILGNLILIPLYQAVGASVASLISEMLSLILFTVLLRRHVAVLRTCLVVLQVFLGNLPMLAFLWWQQQASLLLTIPVSVALAIAGSIAVRALTWRDVLLVRRFLFSRGIERSSETGSRDPRSYSDRNSPPIPVFTDFQDVSNCPTLILPRIRV